MTINWGNKLLIVFVLFAANICYMVYRCTKTNVDLVTAEYYKDELAYQQVIDGTTKANALSSPVTMQKKEKEIVMQFPAEMKNTAFTGTVYFYCASNQHNDRTIVINGNMQQAINAQLLAHGNYVVKINWQAGSAHYYHELPLTIL